MNATSLFKCSLLLFPTLAACSAGSAFTQSGALGTVLGGAAGAGIGASLGKQHGETELGALVGGSIGAGLGLISGAIIHEQSEQMARKEEIVVRQAAAVSPEQLEIDALRKEINASSDWGRNETKSWEDRYEGSRSNSPYQGPASSTYRN